MGWRIDNPLYTLSTDSEVENAKKCWEGESLGGLTEDNNRLPVPVVGLLVLTIITAFLVTAPLWGQRPKAHIYSEMVEIMDDPKVVAQQDDEKAMAEIVSMLQGKSKYERQLTQHPVDMDDLRNLKPLIQDLKRQGKDLEEYSVLGSRTVLANFEGNKRADGSTIRKQPWWDRGYTIDVFYVLYFCLSVIIVVKRLPPYTWQPDHKKHSHSATRIDANVPLGNAKAAR